MPPRPSLPPLLAMAAVLALAVARFAADCWFFLASPYTKDYGEGCVLAMTQLLAERGNYFTSLRDYPLVHGNYPPVFIALNAACYRLFGPSLLAPRLLSVLSTVALLAVLFALLRRRTGSALLACTFTALAVAPWFVVTWAPLGRVDMTALFFSFLGLWLWDKYAGLPGWRRYLAPAAFAAAFFTKQNALLGPAAVLLDMLLDRERRRGLPAAAAAFVGPVAVLFLLLALATHGESYRHLVPYTASADYSLVHMLRSYRAFGALASPLLALSVAALAAGLLGARERVYVLYWLLNVAALATIAKAGAGQNYFIEPWLATLVVAALAVAAAARESPLAARGWPGFVLVAAVLAVTLDYESSRLPLPIRFPGRAVEYAELDRAVAGTTGPILSENLAVLVLNRRPVLLEPFGFALLAKAGRVQPEALARDCAAGRFALIVYENRLRDIPGMGDCLDTRYAYERTLGPYEIYRPR